MASAIHALTLHTTNGFQRIIATYLIVSLSSPTSNRFRWNTSKSKLIRVSRVMNWLTVSPIKADKDHTLTLISVYFRRLHFRLFGMVYQLKCLLENSLKI